MPMLRKVLALLVLTLALPGTAQEPARSDSIVVPFAPPTAQPLRYRLSQTFIGREGPKGAVSEQTLTFQPDPSGGFLLTVAESGTTANGYSFGPDGTLESVRSTQDAVALIAPAVEVQVGPTGRVTRVRDLEALRDNIRRRRQLMVDAEPNEAMRERLRAIMREWPDPAASLTAETAPVMTVPLWSRILGFGGIRQKSGQAREWSDVRPFLGGKAQLANEYSIVLERAPDGALELSYRWVQTPMNFASAVENASVGDDQAMAAEARQMSVNSNWMTGVISTMKFNLTLDGRGMIVRGTYDSRARTPLGVEAGTTVLIERIDAGG